jgi:hypothetical protein
MTTRPGFERHWTKRSCRQRSPRSRLRPLVRPLANLLRLTRASSSLKKPTQPHGTDFAKLTLTPALSQTVPTMFVPYVNVPRPLAPVEYNRPGPLVRLPRTSSRAQVYQVGTPTYFYGQPSIWSP